MAADTAGPNPQMLARSARIFTMRASLNAKCASRNRGPVAQLDRVPGYEPGGRAFESLRARHTEIEKGQ